MDKLSLKMWQVGRRRVATNSAGHEDQKHYYSTQAMVSWEIWRRTTRMIGQTTKMIATIQHDCMIWHPKSATRKHPLKR